MASVRGSQKLSKRLAALTLPGTRDVTCSPRSGNVEALTLPPGHTPWGVTVISGTSCGSPECHGHHERDREHPETMPGIGVMELRHSYDGRPGLALNPRSADGH